MRNKKDFHIVNVTNNIPFRMFSIQTMIPNNFEQQTLNWLVPSTLYPFFRVETRKARMYVDAPTTAHIETLKNMVDTITILNGF